MGLYRASAKHVTPHALHRHRINKPQQDGRVVIPTIYLAAAAATSILASTVHAVRIRIVDVVEARIVQRVFDFLSLLLVGLCLRRLCRLCRLLRRFRRIRLLLRRFLRLGLIRRLLRRLRRRLAGGGGGDLVFFFLGSRLLLFSGLGLELHLLAAFFIGRLLVLRAICRISAEVCLHGEELTHLSQASPERFIEWFSAELVLHVGVGLRFEEGLANLLVAVQRRPMQRSVPCLVRNFEVGLGLQQSFDHLQMAVRAAHQQGSGTAVALCIDQDGACFYVSQDILQVAIASAQHEVDHLLTWLLGRGGHPAAQREDTSLEERGGCSSGHVLIQ
mmetsp:Transcript_147313/g.473297  ORF Transcript_147313/g.473297 Transcript_147313/m.473297 type:complete len:332 (-) Transcript_147313:3-998(-)